MRLLPEDIGLFGGVLHRAVDGGVEQQFGYFVLEHDVLVALD